MSLWAVVLSTALVLHKAVPAENGSAMDRLKRNGGLGSALCTDNARFNGRDASPGSAFPPARPAVLRFIAKSLGMKEHLLGGGEKKFLSASDTDEDSVSESWPLHGG